MNLFPYRFGSKTFNFVVSISVFCIQFNFKNGFALQQQKTQFTKIKQSAVFFLNSTCSTLHLKINLQPSGNYRISQTPSRCFTSKPISLTIFHYCFISAFSLSLRMKSSQAWIMCKLFAPQFSALDLAQVKAIIKFIYFLETLPRNSAC